MPTDETITTTVKNDISWAQHHLFLLIAVVVLVIAGVYGVESLLAKRANEQFQQQQAILQTFTQQNAAIQAQTKAQIDAVTQQNAALQQQLATITVAIAQRDARLQQQQTVVKTLPPPQLAIKWGEVANEPAPSLDANGNAIVPLPLAQKSVDALLAVPTLQADVADLKTQLGQETTIAANNDAKYQAEVKSHTSDNELNAQALKTKDADIKQLKAAARKRDVIIAILSAAFGFAARR